MFSVVRIAGVLVCVGSPGIGLRKLFNACHQVIFPLLRALQQRVFQIFIYHKILQLLVGERENIQGLYLAGGQDLLLFGGGVIH